VGRAGVPLDAAGTAGAWVCPRTGQTYTQLGDVLTEDSK
jgi:hypothetical protein